MSNAITESPGAQAAGFLRRWWYGPHLPAVSFAEVIEAHHALISYLVAEPSRAPSAVPEPPAPQVPPEPATVVDQNEPRPVVSAGRICATDKETSLREDYKSKVAAFCRWASLDEVFWGRDGRSGIAVLLEGPRFKRRARLYRVSDYATSEHPDIAVAIHDWDVLAVRAQTLTGKNARVCMRRIFSSMSDLLCLALGPATAAAAEPGKEKSEPNPILDRQKADLKEATDYYVENARRGAYLTYFWGMCFGALVNGALAFGFVALVHWGVPHLWGIHVSNRAQAYAVGAVVAGAIGTIFSVLLRMTRGGFSISYEIGWTRLFVLGSFRPFIGAVSGLAVHYALKADLISIKSNRTFALIVFLAFLSGFSERFARDIFLAGETAITPGGGSTGGGGGGSPGSQAGSSGVPPQPGAEADAT